MPEMLGLVWERLVSVSLELEVLQMSPCSTAEIVRPM